MRSTLIVSNQHPNLHRATSQNMHRISADGTQKAHLLVARLEPRVRGVGVRVVSMSNNVERQAVHGVY